MQQGNQHRNGLYNSRGYEMRMEGASIGFDFEGHSTSINKVKDTFKDLVLVTENMLKKITDTSELFVSAEEDGNDALTVVSLEYVSFVLPYDGWKELKMDKNVTSKVFQKAE